ncbi:hypothetical protein GCM10011609_84780 [Lentzea pudingi]|uniref:Uncharacterized protein n=1 Tax=Lentzea pudingi TaxID=1789439 RepID=A0ABQ2ITC8_9PSEU|nr:hypothetical protein GCM10011609_84780 [Lentzea pudingi]
MVEVEMSDRLGSLQSRSDIRLPTLDSVVSTGARKIPRSQRYTNVSERFTVREETNKNQTCTLVRSGNSLEAPTAAADPAEDDQRRLKL